MNQDYQKHHNVVRTATEDDILDLMVMAERFCGVAGHKLDRLSMVRTFTQLMSAGVLIRTDAGAAGALIYPLFMSGEMVAQELFWWSEDNMGKAMFDELEHRCKAQGAESMIMIALAASQHDRVKKIYERRGYRHLETNYIKRL